MRRDGDNTGPSRWLVAVVCLVIGAAAPAAAQEAEDEPVEDQAGQEVADETDEEAEDEAGEELDDQGAGPVEGPEVPDDEWIEDDDEDEPDERHLPGLELEAPEGADEDFRRELEDYREAYRRYTDTIDDYEEALENLVETEFERRMAEIEEAYGPRIREAELIEQEQREEAIQSLEAFINEYPDDADHTPDALFRLALLYDQREQQQYEEAQAEYFDRLDEIQDEGGDRDELGDAPERSYEQSEATFRELVEDWPDYRGLAPAFYFLAHMEWDRRNWEASRDLSARLIEHNPESRFAPHAWLMKGEFYFERADRDGPEQIRDNLKKALDAFQNAAAEDGRQYLGDDNYVRVVYSWAWSHYRLENYPQAIDTFRDVVELIDMLAVETGVERDLLREDALAHLADILAMEDWELDGRPPAEDTVMSRIEDYMSEGDDYEREVLVMLGEELFDFLRFDEAIQVYEHVLEMDPMHPDNPEIHGQIVAALHRDYREEEAFAVRREMVDYYGEDSAWYQHQQRVGNEGAMREADNMVRDYLLMAATWYHDQAQTQRNEAMVAQDEELLALTEQKYGRAADAYEEFIRLYPDDGEIFQWTFYYAETLYYAGRYDEAFEQYRVVREFDIPNNPYRETSAFNAVQALEYVMRDKVQDGELTPLALAGTDMDEAREAAEDIEEEEQVDEQARLEQVEVDGRPVPEIVEDYVTAMDRYVVLGLENEEEEYLGAKFAFQAAKVYHDFRQFDESRERFAWIVDNYPEHEVGYLAGSLILESYRQENDFEGLAEWAERLEGVIEGEQAEAVQAEVRQYRLMAMFRAAEDMLEDEDYEAAAEEFIELAREAPDHDLAPRALNNAASVYEIKGDYHRSIEQYEQLFTEYPDHPLTPRAVYRVAVNSEWLFDYDKSVRHYELFYEEFEEPTPEDLVALDFHIADQREEALLQAAQMNEYLQRYSAAADQFEQYFETYPESEFGPETLWAAAEARDKADEHDEMVRVYEQYIEEFGDDPEHASRKIEARSRMASLYEQRDEIEEADDQYETIVETVDDWIEEGDELPPGEATIRELAAEARFTLAERDFEEWDEIVIEGTLGEQERLLEQKQEGVQDLQEQYQEVMEYGNLDWNLAAHFRIGNVLHRMAETLYAVPIPFEEGTEEYWTYQDMLDDIAFPLEDTAIERYRETVHRAREHQIVNEWTERTLAALHEFRPDEYPYFEDEKNPRPEMVGHGVPLLNDQAYEARREREDWEDDEDLEAFDETEQPDEDDADDNQEDDPS